MMNINLYVTVENSAVLPRDVYRTERQYGAILLLLY
jgi:hypothetical protein